MTRSLLPRPGGRFPVTAALLGLVLAFGAGAREASAQTDYGWAVGPRAGVDFIIDEISIGAHALIPFAQLGPYVTAAAYPNIDAFLFGDSTLLRFDFDLAFPFRFPSVPLVPYAGLGFGIAYERRDFAEHTVYDFNLLGGIALQTGVLVESFIETEASLFGSNTVGLYLGLNIYPMFRRQAPPPQDVNPADLPHEEDL
jgi:hypothetical protein